MSSRSDRKPGDCPVTLLHVEGAILARLLPALSLKGVSTPWTAEVKAARARMADEARRWKPS